MTSQIAAGEEVFWADFSDYNSAQIENESNEEDRAEEIEEFQPPPRQPDRARTSPVRCPDTVMMLTEALATYDEAMRSSEKNKWRLALREELDFIERNSTWVHTFLSPEKDAIGCKVLLNRKVDEQCRIVRYTVCLIAMAYVQKEGVDYDETLAWVILFDLLLLIFGNFTPVRVELIMLTFPLLSWTEPFTVSSTVGGRASGTNHRRVCMVWSSPCIFDMRS